MAAVPSIERARSREAAPEVEATRDLYERYGDKILGYCLHQLGSREEAEDATQSTFLNAFRGLGRGVRPELEAAWLFKIAHNVCLSRRRSSWRRRRVEAPADLQLVEDVVPAPMSQAEDLIGLEDVLGRLPETQRRAILLREWQGLSYREIADELEISQAAVETLLFRARRSLAAGLQERPRRAALTRRSSSLGSLFASLKGFLVGGTTAKVAATVTVIAASSVATALPLRHNSHPATPPSPTTAPRAHGSHARPTALVPDRPTLVTPERHRAVATAPAPARPVARHARHHPRKAVPAPARHERSVAPPVVTPPSGRTAAPGQTRPDRPTPPGQAKKAESAKPTPPGQAKQADAGKAMPPGQAKKAEEGKSMPPGQAKKAESTPAGQADPPQSQGEARGRDAAVPPGQAKTEAAEPATQAAPPAVDSLPPGQATKEEVAPSVPAAPSAADPAPPVDVPAPGDQGNGHGPKDH